MKESYHICFTSHDEVLFRDEEDYGVFVNLMALRSFSSEAEILADAEMSTHFHSVVFAENPMLFASALRMSYTKYFNQKYDRKGRMGQKYTFSQKIEGFYHQMVALSYVLRNGLHHGAAPTAFGYVYCSVRELFAKEIGLSSEKSGPFSRADMAAYLPRYSEFPDHWQMNESGVFLRQSFMELRRAEQYYATARNYLYQMNRLTDESWKEVQQKDNTGQPVTLSMIEGADEASVAQMLNNEYGRNFRNSRLQDMDVCRFVDQELLPSYGVRSVYLLSDSQRQRLARQLQAEFHLPEHQIARCLGYQPWPRLQ